MSVIEHPHTIQIDDETILWRYFDKKKFISLLDKRALFFCRLDKFADPFEGSIPKKEANYRIKEKKRIRRFYGTPFNEEKAIENIDAMSNVHRGFQRGATANCWQINSTESDGMWRLYLKNNEGIAIQSNARKIKMAFEKTKQEVYLSKIRYIDYEQDIWYNAKDYPNPGYNFLTPLVHKRVEYKHENEFRLFHTIEDAIEDANYWNSQEYNVGLLIEIEVEILIDKVIFHPTANESTKEKLKKLSNEYGYNFKFENSKLSNKPIF